MKRLLLVPFLIAMTTPAAASEAWSGTWQSGTGKNPTGKLRTIDRDGDLEFQLELWGGPPAHNSGLAQGHMTMRGGVAVFETTKFGGKCRIEFAFTPKRVVIAQKE